MPIGEDYSSWHLVQSHLELAYVQLVDTNPFPEIFVIFLNNTLLTFPGTFWILLPSCDMTETIQPIDFGSRVQRTRSNLTCLSIKPWGHDSYYSFCSITFQDKKRRLLICIHHFESDLIYNMDNTRISGIEPSSVTLTQTKIFKKMKSDAPIVPKQKDVVINPEIKISLNSDNFYVLKMPRINRSRP